MPSNYLLFNFNTLLLEAPRRYLESSGPLPKSFSTYQLEELSRRLMINEPFHIQKPMTLVFDDDQVRYEMNHILSHANMEHIVYNPIDFELYNQYTNRETSAFFRSTLTEAKQTDFKRIYPDLNFAEMQAVNIYTGGAFSYMNMFLRRKDGFFDYPNEVIRSIIIHSIMCCSALAKVPDTTFEKTYRVENIPTAPELHSYLQDRIDAAATQSIIFLEGFVSTTAGNLSQGGDILYIFNRLKGKFIKPLSQCPPENEYLIPPTQIRIEGYDSQRSIKEYRAFKHRFEVSTASELGNVPQEGQEVPTLEELVKLTLGKFKYLHDHMQDSALKLRFIKIRAVFNDLLEKIQQENIRNTTGICSHIASLIHAVDSYLSAQDKQNKLSILTTKIDAFLYDHSDLSSSFLLNILASPITRYLASILLVVSLAGLIVGGLVLPGIGAGLAAASMGGLVIGLGFYSSSKLIEPKEDLQWNYNPA